METVLHDCLERFFLPLFLPVVVSTRRTLPVVVRDRDGLLFAGIHQILERGDAVAVPRAIIPAENLHDSFLSNDFQILSLEAEGRGREREGRKGCHRISKKERRISKTEGRISRTEGEISRKKGRKAIKDGRKDIKEERKKGYQGRKEGYNRRRMKAGQEG
jgi:hypothetical protein